MLIKFVTRTFYLIHLPCLHSYTHLAGPGSGGGSGGGGGGGAGGGAGGVGGGRRLFSDIPSHVQHLLEHQERQHFERASPSRRPVYRKIVSGMQGSVNPSAAAAYHLGVIYILYIIHVCTTTYTQLLNPRRIVFEVFVPLGNRVTRL